MNTFYETFLFTVKLMNCDYERAVVRGIKNNERGIVRAGFYPYFEHSGWDEVQKWLYQQEVAIIVRSSYHIQK